MIRTLALSFKDIAEILKSIDESQAEEINIEVEGLRLAVKKSSGESSRSLPPQDSTDNVAQAPPPQPVTQSQKPPAVEQSGSGDSQLPDGMNIVRAPMVGTFYSRPDPNSEPFVKKGTRVKPGDPLCLIEVMKLYTTIEASVSGTVESVFAEDGKLVQFNQQMFLIDSENDGK